jgi:hypothetical protein
MKNKNKNTTTSPKSNRKIVGRDKGDTTHKYITAHLNHTIHMFGSLEYVVTT